MPKILLNGIEYASGLDQLYVNKIGTATLHTQADNLCDAVNELKGTFDIKTSTVSVATGYTAYANEIKKCANVVSLTLKISDVINPETKGWITLGTIAQGFRPTATVEMVLVNNRTDTQYLSAIGRVSNTGEIRIWGIPNTLVQPLISVTYIAP